MALTERQKTTITQNLQSRIKGQCPMCAKQQWTMGDEIVAIPATSLAGGMALGGPMVPMVQVVCNTCGFVAHHAIGALGINLNDQFWALSAMLEWQDADAAADRLAYRWNSLSAINHRIMSVAPQASSSAGGHPSIS